MDQAPGRIGRGPSHCALPAGGDTIRLIDFSAPVLSNPRSDQDPLLECSVKVYSFADRTANYQDLTHEDGDTDECHLRQLTAWGEEAQGFSYRYHWGDWLAMSHCWGDQEATEVISVNGDPIKISTNMAAGLRAIAQLSAVKKGRLKLWNDFLCLDQQNTQEIQQELKRVPRIYANAFAVVAWIGPAAAQSNLVMNLLRTKLSRLEGDRDSASRILKSINRNEWKALSSMLLWRPYWRRTWITQELTLAGSRTILLCGNETAPLTQLWALVKAMIRDTGLCHRLLADALGTGDSYYDPMRHQTFYTIARLLYLHDIDQTRRSMLTDRDYNFLPLLDVCRGSQQKYLRDKVYGVLGLLPFSVTSLIEPDLNKPLHDICTDLVIASIQALGRLDILQNCMYKPASPVFPTWTPDLSVTGMSHSLGTRAIMDVGGDLRSQPRISADRRVIICRGFLLDEIDHLTPPQWPLDPISQQEADDATPRVEIPPRSREAVQKSFWEVLVGGSAGYPHDRLPPPEYVQLLDLPWPSSYDTMAPPEIAQDLIDNHTWCTADEKQDMITFVTFRQRAGRAFSLAGHRLGSFFPSHHQQTISLPSYSCSTTTTPPKDQHQHPPSPPPPSSPSTLASTATPQPSKWHNRAMLRQACYTLKRRRLFVTSRAGRLGVCGRQARPGDVVAVLRGCSAPLVLRRQQRRRRGKERRGTGGEAHVEGECSEGKGKGEALDADDGFGVEEDDDCDNSDDDDDEKRIPGGGERYMVIGPCYVEGLLHDGDELRQRMQEEGDVVLV